MSRPQRTREELEHLASSVPFWWHSIDLGQGVVTNGMKSASLLAKELESLRLPDLEGKSVLDIGTYDGFYAFEAERQGARRVVALDHYVWSMDVAENIKHWKDCKQRGVPPGLPHTMPYWRPAELPGKRAFDAARDARGSRVEEMIRDFMTTNLDEVGSFDVVLYLGVLYHMENPFEALKRVAAVTREVAVIETEAIFVPGFEHMALCEFFESNELNADSSNWWAPNRKALTGMCRAAGFSRAEVVAGPAPRSLASLVKRLAFPGAYLLAKLPLGKRIASSIPRLNSYRAVVQAWK